MGYANRDLIHAAGLLKKSLELIENIIDRTQSLCPHEEVDGKTRFGKSFCGRCSKPLEHAEEEDETYTLALCLRCMPPDEVAKVRDQNEEYKKKGLGPIGWTGPTKCIKCGGPRPGPWPVKNWPNDR